MPRRTKTESVRAAKAKEPTALSLEATAPVDLQAAKDDARRPTFTITGYTGAVMNVAGFFSPVIVDLNGLKASGGEIPVLRSHDMDRIVGQTTAVVIDAKGVEIVGTVTGDNADATEVVSQAKNGFKWRASIGANIVRREFLESGKKATVNGREVTGPMVIARESQLDEVSFVAIGADNQTSASVAASVPVSIPTPSQKGAPPVNFEDWLRAKGIDPTALEDPIRSTLQAAYDAEQGKDKAAQTQANPAFAKSLDEIVKAQRDEDNRVREITRLTAEAISKRPAMVDRFEELAKKAIEAKSTVAEFDTALLRIRADAPPPYAVHHGVGPETRTSQALIEATLCRVGRLANIEKHFDARTLEASEKHFRHGIGLQELLLMGARENGYTGYSASNLGSVLRAAFPRNDIRAEGFSTLSLPGILSNVMNKFLVDYFNSVESAWRDVVAIRNVRDFKQISSYSLTGDLQYELVGPTGELKHGTIGEATYTNQAATYGKILAITRSDLINDDLGALTRVPQRLGRGGALKLNDVIWTTFLAGVGSFWASGNANLITGATTTLTAVGLTAALLKFRQQTDPNGKPLGLTPAVLLVPPELEVTAKQLMNSTFFVAGGSATTAQIPNTNTWQGAYKVASSTYLSNSSYTGNSTTAWWLIADSADVPTIELAVLNGREVPTIERADAEFDTLGIQVRAYHDFGAALQEPRGSIRSAGA